jgi:hypothetical protein
MNYALAEILVKNDGSKSLDSNRAEHAHHGLEISFPAKLPSNLSLKEAASALRAKPHTKQNGRRSGTFNLWHETSRETIVLGKIIREHTETYGPVLSPSPKRLPEIASGGISLLECLQYMPSLTAELSHEGINSNYLRGRIYAEVINGKAVTNILVHPNKLEMIEALKNSMHFSAQLIEDVNVVEYDAGFSISIAKPAERPFGFNLPMITSLTRDEQRLCCTHSPINEFGAFLAALFILGNLCRYFPDLWLDHVTANSSLAIFAEVLCEEFYHRVPCLLLAELTQHLFVE